MKTIIIAILLSGTASAADFYADAYRFDNDNSTGKAGLTIRDFNAEFSFEDGGLAIGGRKYISFKNIEIGAQLMLTDSVADGYKDSRVINIEGSNYLTLNPYFKAGSDLFVIAKLDESNKAVIQVGFSLGN